MVRYVIARTPSSRPSLMHKTREDDIGMTLCGRDITAWSRAYMGTLIPQIFCLRCAAAS